MRSIPVLVASVAVSGLYMGVVRADDTPQIILIEDIFDEITVGAGYYEEDTIIKTAIPTPETFAASPYDGGENDYLVGDNSLDSMQDITLNDYHNGTEYQIDLGVDEQMTLLPGYYYDNVTIKNGVQDRGDPTTILDGDNQGVDLPAGYYSDGSVTINSDYSSIINALNTTFGTSFTGNEKFKEIADSITGDIFSLNRTGTAYFKEKLTGDNTRIGTSPINEELTNVALAGETIDLGVDEQLVIPAGYYNDEIIVQNGVVHQETVNTTVSANNNDTYGAKEVSYGPGYYDSITVQDNTPSGTITMKNGETVKTWNANTHRWE